MSKYTHESRSRNVDFHVEHGVSSGIQGTELDRTIFENFIGDRRVVEERRVQL